MTQRAEGISRIYDRLVLTDNDQYLRLCREARAVHQVVGAERRIGPQQHPPRRTRRPQPAHRGQRISDQPGGAANRAGRAPWRSRNPGAVDDPGTSG